MKNIVKVVFVAVCGLFLLYACQETAKTPSNEAQIQQLNEELKACQEAAEASSAETFILQQLAEKHKAEAEEHRQAAEEHKKIADDALEQVEKLKK